MSDEVVLPKGKKMKANGIVEEFYTLVQLGIACGNRRPITFKAMEKKGHFPAANFTGADVVLADQTTRKGARLYSRTLVLALVPIFKKLRVGVKTPEPILQEIRDAFTAEKIRLQP
jgi:hypothetical protein